MYVPKTFQPSRHADGLLAMPCFEQLLDAYIDRISFGYCTHPETKPHLGSDEPQDSQCPGVTAAIDGKHEEFCALPRKASPCKPPMHTVSRYVRRLDGLQFD
jgi:hypothetical protein